MQSFGGSCADQIFPASSTSSRTPPIQRSIRHSQPETESADLVAEIGEYVLPSIRTHVDI
jgi:hypothetical protein